MIQYKHVLHRRKKRVLETFVPFSRKPERNIDRPTMSESGGDPGASSVPSAATIEV
jgi:hypothetical protein